MKNIKLIALTFVIASSCQHRTPASSEESNSAAGSVSAEGCSYEASEDIKNRKLRIAKKQFTDLMYLIRKKDRTKTESQVAYSQVRKYQSQSFTTDATQAFTRKVFSDLNKINPPYNVYIKEGELLGKTFNTQDHSIELTRYHIQIRESADKVYNLRLLCQYAFNCLNTQGGKSLCSIEEP